MLSPYHPPEEFKRVQEHDSRIKESEGQERTKRETQRQRKDALQRTEADGHGGQPSRLPSRVGVPRQRLASLSVGPAGTLVGSKPRFLVMHLFHVYCVCMSYIESEYCIMVITHKKNKFD